MSERLRRAYEEKEKAERKVRLRAADPARAEQRLMGELFRLRNPQFYPRYTMPRKVREDLAELGLLAIVNFPAAGRPRAGETPYVTWSFDIE